MTVWQPRLGGRVRDAITAYYARYPDATPEEIEAWLTDRGFKVTRTDIEDLMAALDTEPDWRTGWVNRNIGTLTEAFDPDQFLLSGESEDQEMAAGSVGVSDEEVLAAAESCAGEEEVEDSEDLEELETADGAGVEDTAGVDWLPGVVLGGVGLAITIGIAALILALLG